MTSRGARLSVVGLAALAGLSSGCPTAPPDPQEPTTDDPRADVLRINELMASNTSGCADDAGEFDDWIELINLDDADVPLDGVTISDDNNERGKASLDGLSIAGGGRLVLFADDTIAQGSTHLPFKLSAAGEELVIAIDGAIVDEVTWTAAVSDLALARFPDGSGEFANCATSTCGAPNGSSCP